jgi:hypothetical protein
MRIWKPAQVTSWTVTATGGWETYYPRVVTDLGRYVEITGWILTHPNWTGAGTDALNVSITNVTRNNAGDDIEPLQVDMWATNQADGVPGSVRQTTGQSYTDSAPGPVVPVVQPTPNVTAYVNASLSRNVSSIARGATITDDVWTVFVAANGEHSITGGVLRINMPSGVSSWAWSVNAVGFVTYDDNSPAGGVPYIELANIVAGNHPASYMTVTISRVTHDDSLDDVGDLTAELFGGFFGNLSTTATDTAPGPTLGPVPAVAVVRGRRVPARHHRVRTGRDRLVVMGRRRRAGHVGRDERDRDPAGRRVPVAERRRRQDRRGDALRRVGPSRCGGDPARPAPRREPRLRHRHHTTDRGPRRVRHMV